jgi:hypothetical protein
MPAAAARADSHHFLALNPACGAGPPRRGAALATILVLADSRDSPSAARLPHRRLLDAAVSTHRAHPPAAPQRTCRAGRGDEDDLRSRFARAACRLVAGRHNRPMPLRSRSPARAEDERPAAARLHPDDSRGHAMVGIVQQLRAGVASQRAATRRPVLKHKRRIPLAGPRRPGAQVGGKVCGATVACDVERAPPGREVPNVTRSARPKVHRDPRAAGARLDAGSCVGADRCRRPEEWDCRAGGHDDEASDTDNEHRYLVPEMGRGCQRLSVARAITTSDPGRRHTLTEARADTGLRHVDAPRPLTGPGAPCPDQGVLSYQTRDSWPRTAPSGNSFVWKFT